MFFLHNFGDFNETCLLLKIIISLYWELCSTFNEVKMGTVNFIIDSKFVLRKQIKSCVSKKPILIPYLLLKLIIASTRTVQAPCHITVQHINLIRIWKWVFFTSLTNAVSSAASIRAPTTSETVLRGKRKSSITKENNRDNFVLIVFH